MKAVLPCVGCVTATTVRPAFAGPLRLSGIGIVGQHVDGIVAAVFIHRGTVIDCVRCVVDVGNGDVHGGRVHRPIAIADGVGEGVRAKVIGRRSVGDPTGCESDGAVCWLRYSHYRQAGIERWRQIVGISVVGQHVDGVVAAVFVHRGTVIDCIRCVVDVGDGDVDGVAVSIAPSLSLMV